MQIGGVVVEIFLIGMDTLSIEQDKILDVVAALLFYARKGGRCPFHFV